MRFTYACIASQIRPEVIPVARGIVHERQLKACIGKVPLKSLGRIADMKTLAPAL